MRGGRGVAGRWSPLSSPRVAISAALAVCAFVCTPSPAEAQGAVCAPEYEGQRRATVEHEGAPGVWFATPVARCMLADLAELQEVRRRVSLLEERLELRDGQLERLVGLVGAFEGAERRAVEAMEAADARRREAEERVLAWHRSPGLWIAVGVALSAVLVIATAYGLSAAGGGP